MASWRGYIGTGGKMNERLEVKLRTLKAVLAMWNILMKLFALGSTTGRPLWTGQNWETKSAQRGKLAPTQFLLILFLLGSQNRQSDQ